MNRECMKCHKNYGKVCKVHVWVMRKIGDTIRPVRIIVKMCTHCCDSNESKKIINELGWKRGPRNV